MGEDTWEVVKNVKVKTGVDCRGENKDYDIVQLAWGGICLMKPCSKSRSRNCHLGRK